MMMKKSIAVQNIKFWGTLVMIRNLVEKPIKRILLKNKKLSLKT